jgi:methylmalonyl-CoA mutase
MQQVTDFFAEFPPVTKDEWLARIAKDLKDKPIQDLYWTVEGIETDPFGHPDDFPVPPTPLSATANHWEICEQVDCADPAEANTQALEALTFGAESLQFNLHTSNSDTLEQALQGIHLDYIGLHFSSKSWSKMPPAALLMHLGNVARAQGIKPSSLRGSIHYSPSHHHTVHPDWRYIAELIGMARVDFPNFGVIGLSAHPEAKTVVEELSDLLHQANTCLEKLSERGVEPAETARQIRFNIQIGKSYFLEIAKLRAFNLLWMNVLKAWNTDPVHTVVSVEFRPEVYTDDLYTNMIRATTMSMSAVLGGAARLTVLPYDAGREQSASYPQAFARRIARNVQHLLKLESYFDAVPDPAAGSYYIEKLTQQIASKVWESFQQPA